MVAGEQMRTDYKWAEEIFENAENVLYLDFSDDFIVVYVCQNWWNVHFKHVYFIVFIYTSVKIQNFLNNPVLE